MQCATPEAVQLFHEGSLLFADMEHNGIRIDTDYLDAKTEEVGRKIKSLERKLQENEVYSIWRKRFGRNLNLNSGEQLGKILFEDLGYAPPEQTASGRHKVDADTLIDIDHPFVKTWRSLAKLRKAHGTYLKGIRREVDEYGFLHPVFNLHTVSSFRSSGSDPNFQNIPIRDPVIGEMIRRSFISRGPNWQIVEVDFSGIEVRVAACYNKDPVLIDYIHNSPPKDMHRDMAMQIFMLKEHEVGKKSTRDASKNMFVFPQFYGSYYVNCARDIWKAMERRKFLVEGTDKLVKDHLEEKGIKRLGACDPKREARPGTFEYHLKKVENDFWNRRFKVYTRWKQSWWEKYQKRGWLQMHTGFVCSGDLNRKQVINFPVQGSAFHCLLWSTIQIGKELKRRKMKTKLVGQIHDSVIADVHKRELDDYLHLVKEITTSRLVRHWKWLIVPMSIEMEVCPPGESWFDKKEIKI